MTARALMSGGFNSHAGRLPLQSVPKPEPRTAIVERYENGKWVQKRLVWDGKSYVEASK